MLSKHDSFYTLQDEKQVAGEQVMQSELSEPETSYVRGVFSGAMAYSGISDASTDQ